jgi:3-oxoacyl-[acyl-carrier protein] reductase
MYIFITGATGGIGSAIAKKFAVAGNTIGMHYNTSEQKANALAKELENKGAKTILFKADLSTEEGRVALCENIKDKFSNCDILINNAGASLPALELGKYKDNDISAIMGLNFNAPFMLSQTVLPLMENKGKGSIVNISSIGVKFSGGKTTAVYSSSKAALETATKNMAKFYAAKNIRVNAIRAGVTNTPFHDKVQKNMDERISLIPMKRAAEPEEIAEMAVFISSDKAAYITGQIISVSGGE